VAKTKGNPGYHCRLSIGGGRSWAELEELKLNVDIVPGLEPVDDTVKELEPGPESEPETERVLESRLVPRVDAVLVFGLLFAFTRLFPESLLLTPSPRCRSAEGADTCRIGSCGIDIFGWVISGDVVYH
jgi:hypothetical protein